MELFKKLFHLAISWNISSFLTYTANLYKQLKHCNLYVFTDKSHSLCHAIIDCSVNLPWPAIFVTSHYLSVTDICKQATVLQFNEETCLCSARLLTVTLNLVSLQTIFDSSAVVVDSQYQKGVIIVHCQKPLKILKDTLDSIVQKIECDFANLEALTAKSSMSLEEVGGFKLVIVLVISLF